MTNDKLADEIEQHKLHLGGYLTDAQWDQIIAALREPATEAVLEEALTRMDRAREILRGPNANWGMLDTSDLRAALKVKAASPERPQSGEMAIRNDECWEIIKALDAEGKASSLIGYPLTDTNRTTIRAWLQSRIEGRKLAAAEAERGKT